MSVLGAMNYATVSSLSFPRKRAVGRGRDVFIFFGFSDEIEEAAEDFASGAADLWGLLRGHLEYANWPPGNRMY